MMNENTLSCKKQMHLPPEVLSEILSWLDVLSLLRFKIVCKEWCYLIEDREFMRTHMKKSRGHWVFGTIMGSRNYNRYRVVDSYFGLVFEHNFVTQYSRLRNPSTRKTLELPCQGQSVPRDTKICHIHSSNTLKLVVPCLYWTTPSQPEERVVFKVLTVGIDNAWREIDIPFPKFSIIDFHDTAMVGEVYFMMCHSNPSVLEVICLEMGNEQLSRIKIPNGIFSCLYGVVPLAWGDNLALASVIKEEDEIHVWVLEDHKENRWAEKKIIVPLKFLGPRDKEKVYIRKFHDNGLLITDDFKELIILDVVSGTIRLSYRAPQGQQFDDYYFIVPSLQHPKGDEAKHHLLF